MSAATRQGLKSLNLDSREKLFSQSHFAKIIQASIIEMSPINRPISMGSKGHSLLKKAYKGWGSRQKGNLILKMDLLMMQLYGFKWRRIVKRPKNIHSQFLIPCLVPAISLKRHSKQKNHPLCTTSLKQPIYFNLSQLTS